MALTIDTRELNGKYVIAVAGEVDLYSSPDLRQAVQKAQPKAESGLGVDLSQVEYMDSSGVATLVEGLRGAGGRPFVLIAPSAAVMNVLQLSRLNTIFDIRDEF